MGQSASKSVETGANRAPIYSPSVNNFHSFEEVEKSIESDEEKRLKVLVIGAGCAGLGAAWHLNRCKHVEVTLFESQSKLGGHANTITVDGVDVDTGFMVYNHLNYPNLCALFEELDVKGIPTSMGFSVSMNDGGFEWCSDSLSGLLATPSNAYNTNFYVMMKDILRFNEEAKKLLSHGNNNETKNITVKDFLHKHGLSDAFRDYYLIPMTAAIWSATTEDMLNFPASSLFTFLNNHLLLQVSDNVAWLTPAKRSQEYVNKIAKELQGKYYLNTTITKFERVYNQQTQAFEVHIATKDNSSIRVFDRVVFACHPDQALAILGDCASDREKQALGAFHYSDNITYVHCDDQLMPKSRAAWTSWNYIGQTDHSTVAGKKPVFVTYWLNKLQSLEHNKEIFVSLNPHVPPASDKTFATLNYSHPQYSLQSVHAQRLVADLQGEQNTFFCGAWMGYGFHEDGLRSGLEVATVISQEALAWTKKWGQQYMIPSTKPALIRYHNKQTTFNQSLVGKVLLNPAKNLFATLCREQVLKFFETGFVKGQFTIELPDKTMRHFKGKEDAENGQSVKLCVFDDWFFVRLALEADLGLARSYINGEFEVEDTGVDCAGLTRFYQLLIDNMPNCSNTNQSGGVDASKLVTALAGQMLNALRYKLTMDNSIANSQSNIHAHYDLSNALFETFLDKDYMMYSSAIFRTEIVESKDKSQPSKLRYLGSLEEAQQRKIDALLSRLEPIDSDTHLLDIGFGWGGIAIRAAEKYGCKVTGITLSVEQKSLAEERVRAKRLEHLISFELVDYRVFAERKENKQKFDRIVSCEMIEAVGHNHLGSFFAAVNNLLKLNGIFVMQAITMPDSRYKTYVNSADFCNTIIFPGGCCPALSALLDAMANNSTLHLESCVNANMHYAETLRRWRQRFNSNLPKIVTLGFDDAFIRCWNLYLSYCEAGFENQVINLQILTFSRPNNNNMIQSHQMHKLII